jgi:hypothetical protein
MQRWNASRVRKAEARLTKHIRYNHSENGRARNHRYDISLKGYQRQQRYNQSAKGRQRDMRAWDRRLKASLGRCQVQWEELEDQLAALYAEAGKPYIREPFPDREARRREVDA